MRTWSSIAGFTTPVLACIHRSDRGATVRRIVEELCGADLKAHTGAVAGAIRDLHGKGYVTCVGFAPSGGVIPSRVWNITPEGREEIESRIVVLLGACVDPLVGLQHDGVVPDEFVVDGFGPPGFAPLDPQEDTDDDDELQPLMEPPTGW